jgi:hypothetical protein
VCTRTMPGLAAFSTGVLVVAAVLLLAAGAGMAATAAQPRLVVPGTWSEVPSIPNPGQPTFNEYNAISCVGPSFCVAMGDGSNGNIYPLAALWNGAAWSATTNVAQPTQAGVEVNFTGVSCLTQTWCMASGWYDSDTHPQTTIVEQWNGSSWSIVPTPDPGGLAGNDALTGVSCTAATFCVAVGTNATGPTTVPLILFWNGSTWTTAVLPGGLDNSHLKGVSCVGPWCEAVGSQGAGPLALTGTGTSWSAQTVPSGAPGSTLESVSCFSTTRCAAVGWQNSDVLDANLVEQWDGAAWSLETVPNASTTDGDLLNGVDCFGPTSCVAGGAVNTAPPNVFANQILAWNGNSWSLQTTPMVTGTTGDTVLTVACVPDDQCLAAGDAGSPLAFTAGPQVLTAPIHRPGYDEVASDGGLFSFGAPFFGSMGGKHLNAPIVGMAMTPDGGGYWEVASDGGLFAFGDAAFYGSMGGKPLNAPIVGMVPTLDGRGYYEVASDGGLFAFGDAVFLGSMGGKPLNASIVGIALAPAGGYYEVASDGGLFAFGGTALAPFLGSMGGKPLNKPIVAMAVTPQGGYYEAASDGGLFAFGGTALAPFLGSMGGKPLNKPIVDLSVNPAGGYYEVATDGGLFSFGTPFLGSMGGKPLNAPIVGMGE